MKNIQPCEEWPGKVTTWVTTENKKIKKRVAPDKVGEVQKAQNITVSGKPLIIDWLIQFFNKYLLSTYYASETILGAGEYFLQSLNFMWWKAENKFKKYLVYW